MRIAELADGTRLEFPDDAADDVIDRVVKSHLKPAAAPQEAAPDPTGSYGQNVLAGVGRAITSGGRAVKEAIDVPAQALERTFGTFRPLGMPSAAQSAQQTQANIAEARQLDRPLMQTAGGKTGDVLGNIAMLAPTAFIPGANTIAGSGVIGGLSNALLTQGSAAERATAGAWGVAGGAGGTAIGNAVGKYAAGKLASRAGQATEAQTANALRDATLQSGREAGFVVPPATVNNGMISRTLESFGGKAQTAQMASLKNLKVADDLAKQELGLPAKAPLNLETLRGIRKEEGKIYEAVAASGRIATDDIYKADLLALSQISDRVALDFPDLAVAAQGPITKMTDGLARDSFDARAAIEVVKDLRSKGSKNLSGLVAASNPEAAALGKAQVAAANAVEDQVMRNLEAQGKGELAQAFDAARVRIAKTYSVQNALNENTGHVIGKNLASQLKKGKPLSGGLEQVARFSSAFPEATQQVKGSPGVSALDIFGGLGLGGLAGLGAENSLLPPWAAALALPVARNAARSAALSRIGQVSPSYAPGLLGTAGLKTLEQAAPYGGLLGTALAR